jgi:hypothetical protein
MTERLLKQVSQESSTMTNETTKVGQQPRSGEMFTALAANMIPTSLLQTTLLLQTETVLRMQSDLFNSIDTLSRNWLDHRQDDFRSALSTVEQMGGVEDAAERSSLWNDWMTERFKRWSGEASELAEQAQTLSRTFADRTSAIAYQPPHLKDAGGRREKRTEGVRG